MKKIPVLLLILLMTASCAFGCTEKPTAATTEAVVTEAPTEPAQTEAATTGAPVTEAPTEAPTTEEPETEPVTFGEFVIEPDETATLAVTNVYGDHMVVQRDTKIKIWGTSNKDGAEIRGLFMDDEARATVADGKWEMTFSPKAATAEPQTITIDDSCGNTVTINDVLVGDVFIVAGQSNAEITVMNYQNIYSKVNFDQNKPLRLFMQGADGVIAVKKTTALEPSEEVINPKWRWKTATKAAIFEFSALGWCFSEELLEQIDIPVGVVCTAANGAKINELMPPEMVKEFKYKTGGNVAPSQYYNALVHPFLRMKFKAMIFFQGESEGFAGASPGPKKYARDLEALFTEYRTRWGFDFPIYCVQASDYTAEGVKTCSNIGQIRAQQYDMYKSMKEKGVRLIPSYDLGADEGYFNYFHSPYKRELAERILKLALADLYGVGTVDEALAPEIAESTLSADKTYYTVRFNNVGEGLTTSDGGTEVYGFAIGKVNKLTAVRAEIVSKDTVKLYLPERAALNGIGYAVENHVNKETANLCNSYGIPALAFYK